MRMTSPLRTSRKDGSPSFTRSTILSEANAAAGGSVRNQTPKPSPRVAVRLGGRSSAKERVGSNSAKVPVPRLGEKQGGLSVAVRKERKRAEVNAAKRAISLQGNTVTDVVIESDDDYGPSLTERIERAGDRSIEREGPGRKSYRTDRTSRGSAADPSVSPAGSSPLSQGKPSPSASPLASPLNAKAEGAAQSALSPSSNDDRAQGDDVPSMPAPAPSPTRVELPLPPSHSCPPPHSDDPNASAPSTTGPDEPAGVPAPAGSYMSRVQALASVQDRPKLGGAGMPGEASRAKMDNLTPRRTAAIATASATALSEAVRRLRKTAPPADPRLSSRQLETSNLDTTAAADSAAGAVTNPDVSKRDDGSESGERLSVAQMIASANSGRRSTGERDRCRSPTGAQSQALRL